MRRLENRPLDNEEIDEILRNIEGEDVVLVGGQALITWSEYFHDIASEDLRPFGPYVSMDLDLLGLQAVAERFAARIGGRFNPATLDDPGTVNTATVTYERNGRPIVIDFLIGLHGIAPPLLEKDAALEIDAAKPGAGASRPLMVLHPLLLLRSKLANVVGDRLHRSDPGSLNQMRAAPVILRAYLQECLDTHLAEATPGPPKEAQRTACELSAFIGTQVADRAFENHGIDLVSILEAVAGHPAWDDRFRVFQIEQQIPILRAKRARRIDERARKRGAQSG